MLTGVSFADEASCTGAESFPAAEPMLPRASTWRRARWPRAAAELLPRLLQILRSPLMQARTRRLRVSETVSLGDKRFLSIVQVDGVEYLVGVGSSQVSLLTRLEKRASDLPSFEQVATEAWQKGGSA